MVRITGSVNAEKSVNAPTGDCLSSVVRRKIGNRAKRMRGTASNVPTNNEPSPSNTPRKDRLVSRDNRDGEGLRVVFSEFSTPSSMHSLSCHDLSHQQPIGLRFQNRHFAGGLLLGRQ